MLYSSPGCVYDFKHLFLHYKTGDETIIKERKRNKTRKVYRNEGRGRVVLAGRNSHFERRNRPASGRVYQRFYKLYKL